jgi:hypothetical protein
MLKRKILLNDYNTAEHFWTLAGWSCPTPEPVTNLVEVPGRVDGPLDASTALTDDIRYTTRPLEVRLESSEGTRLERKARIDDLVRLFHGQRVMVWGPDDAEHYLVARLSVKPEYNDLAHAAVVVTGTCEPWLYANDETQVSVAVESEELQAVTLSNDRRPACPMITVTGEVRVEHNGSSFTLSEGVYKLPDVVLVQGENVVQVAGAGSATFTYRKAVL